MTAENKKDYFWILIVSVLIMIGSSIPTWAGYHFETFNLRFRGLYYDSQDYSVHIGTMDAGAHGDWAYQFRFTTEPHNPAYLRLFYVVLGHISGWLGIPLETMFHVARWVFGLIALFVLYQFMRQVFPEVYWAQIAFLIAALGSGLGWFQLLFGWSTEKITPIDFWLADDYVFFSLSVFPHFAFVTAAMCWVLLLWHRFLEEPKWSRVFRVALIAILVQFVNPIAFATVDAGLVGGTVFSWWRAKKIRVPDVIALIAIALAQIPLLIYNFMVLGRDPLWSQFTAQNQTLSPPPSYYVWGFALFWPLAIVGLISSFRTKSNAIGSVLFWIVTAFILAYVPFAIQRRFLQNITIPLGILATMGLKYLLEISTSRHIGKSSWRSSVVSLVLFLISMSSIQLSLGSVAYLQTYPEHFYYPASLDSAVTWLREHAYYNDFVLASEATSQLLVQKAGMRTYAGHEMETLDYRNKLTKVSAFYEGRYPDLANPPIQWVIYGPDEKAINPNFVAPKKLELVFETPELRIYQVK